MYYYVLKSKTGHPQGFLDYDWQFTTQVSESMIFDSVQELEEWMDETWEEEERIHGDEWRTHFTIQKVHRNTMP